MQSFSESLNSDLTVRKLVWSDTHASFVVTSAGKSWGVDFYRKGEPKAVEVSFMRRNSFYPTGESSGLEALSVYGTIGKVLVDYVNQFPVDKIWFDSASPRTNTLYTKLGNRLAKHLGMKLTVLPDARWTLERH